MSEAKKVKVKILKHIGQHEPGQVIEVSEDVAANLCRVVHINFGEGQSPEPFQHALPLDEALALEEVEKNPVVGGVNRIQTPSDPTFDEKYKELVPKKDEAPKEEMKVTDDLGNEASFEVTREDPPAPLQEYSGGPQRQKGRHK